MRLSLFLITAFLYGANAEETSYPTEADLASHATESAELLKSVLDDDWSVTVVKRTIKIESKFDIYRILMISRQFMPPPIDASNEVLDKEASPEKYVIYLRFEKPLDRKEFIKRRSERQKHADVLNFGASSKTKWSVSAKAYMTIEVPRYRFGFYEVYRKLPESPARKVYPLSAIKKVGAAKEVIDTSFGRLRTGND